MQLFMLRHADAATVAATDDARRLSEKGIDQARKVARLQHLADDEDYDSLACDIDQEILAAAYAPAAA